MPQAEALAEVQRRPRSLALSVESAGPQRRPPAGFEQAVPGTMVMFLLLALYAGLWAMLSLLLGSLARTEQQVVGLGVIAANVLAALRGCWWPIEITPLWAQKLALLFPTGWAMDALHKLVSFGEPAGAILPHLAAILTAALAAGWAASRRFRFQ